MNKFVSQYTANGTLTEFAFTFDIVQGRSVNVYKTLSGNNADEDNDLVATNTYTVVLTNPNADLSKGSVIFNTAPENGSIITITPDEKTDVTVSFSNTTPLNQNNLNKAYNQQSSTISQDSENFKVSSLRYNINENEANINYNNKLTPLSDKGFWRREGNDIISQDFNSFVDEVSEEVAGSVKEQVNASASNTNITSKLASNPINTPVSGDILKVDNAGQVIVDKTLTNVVSALSGSHWSKKWAISDSQVFDDYGNTGFSAKYYSSLANVAATSTSGIIDELYVYDTVNTTSKIDLIEYRTNPNEPWYDVLENSFTVYIDGKMVQSPTAYSESGGTSGGTYSYTVDIKENPTLASPSSITITPAVPINTQILISRGVAQGNSSTMFATGSNYKTSSPDSKIANRDLTNVDIGSYPIASESQVGVSKIATQNDVDNGVDDTKSITSKKLSQSLWSFNLKIWQGQESVVLNSNIPSYDGIETLTLDLTSVPMKLADGSTQIYDLSNKKQIYYSFDFDFQCGPDKNKGSVIVSRGSGGPLSLDGITLLKATGYISSGSNAQSSYATHFLDVQGNQEFFNIVKEGQKVTDIYDNKISILGWVD